jgi:hypothetical protein
MTKREEVEREVRERVQAIVKDWTPETRGKVEDALRAYLAEEIARELPAIRVENPVMHADGRFTCSVILPSWMVCTRCGIRPAFGGLGECEECDG